MTTLKPVARLHPALRDDIGDLTTRRPVPGPGVERVGAFLFLNHHGPQTYPPGNGGLPFGPHPHRGFETVTFILQGPLAHRDTAGHESIIDAGGVQWMTAGSGIVHSELSPDHFKREGGPLELLQLWVNLPARLKMTAPRYVGLQRDQIPALTTDDGRATVNLIAGAWGGRVGPIASLTGVFMTTVELKAGGAVRFEGLKARDVFLYVARGEVSVDGTKASAFNLAALGQGDAVEIAAAGDALVVFGHAEPIDEPVVSHGPFVMNTVREIHQAITDFRAGRFGVPG
jgi:redox-sensitive bicupin YhaK (pirin superfamily)